MESPVQREIRSHGIGSVVALAGHPIHAMLVSFPIALVVATLGCDVFFWWTADPFWARAALWSAGFAFWLGVLASVAGVAELLLVKGIRTRTASWNHAVAAMMLLSVAGTNWGMRVGDHVAAVLPLGVFLSFLASLLVVLAGWHGGKLVFHHGIGTMVEDND
jgi:uncharacterized membrane protein